MIPKECETEFIRLQNVVLRIESRIVNRFLGEERFAMIA